MAFSRPLASLLEAWAFPRVLDYVGKLGVVLAVIAFLRELPRWRTRVSEEAERRRYEFWKTIDAAQAARAGSHNETFSSHALRIALESLASETDSNGSAIPIGPITLDGALLPGIDLRSSHLRVAGFRRCDLSGADFCGATLDKSYFQRARLFGTDFSGAAFRNQTVLRQAVYDDNTVFPEVPPATVAAAYRIAPGAELENAALDSALLWDANLRGASLRGACLVDAIVGGDVSEADLSGADLSRAKMGETDFSGTTFRDACLREADLRGALLRRAVLAGADLEYARLEDADLDEADLRGVQNLALGQILSAANWDSACYDEETGRLLGL